MVERSGLRQAIVVVHGMGEQRPGQALVPFSQMIIAEGTKWFARPTFVGDSFEARFHEIPEVIDGEVNSDLGADTDVYEYHWSYRMKENRLQDLGNVAFRILLPTTGPWHLALVAFLLYVSLVVAGAVRRAWDVPQGIGPVSWPTAWLRAPAAAWPLPTVRLLLVGALAALVGGFAYYVTHRRRRSVRVLVSIAATTLVLVAQHLVGDAPYLAERTVSWGGLVALALLAFSLRSLIPRTPKGLRLTWVLVWVFIVTAADQLLLSRWDEVQSRLSKPSTLPVVLLGTAGAGVLALVAGRLAPWLTTSFVDVVRYVDTSPRSYEVRRSIRQGLVDLLAQLHDMPTGRSYNRIVVVAHSLGSYISYDAISTLWFRRAGAESRVVVSPKPDDLSNYQDQQADDFRRISSVYSGRAPVWRVSNLFTFGSPMYLADSLVTRKRREFEVRKERHDFFACPPEDDVTLTGPGLAVDSRQIARREIAAFGVVQWTNAWYPTGAGLYGDPFGGELSPLFGFGIKDSRVRDGWRSCVPYAAHAAYMKSTRGEPQRGDPTFHSLLKEVITFPE